MSTSSPILDELCEEGLREELLATGQALNTEVFRFQDANDYDPGDVRTIEKYVLLWTAYCLFTRKINFLHEEHELWCQRLSDLTFLRALGKSDGVAFLVQDVDTTKKYVRWMVAVLEAQDDSSRTA